jgi:hypothetical protein
LAVFLGSVGGPGSWCEGADALKLAELPGLLELFK